MAGGEEHSAEAEREVDGVGGRQVARAVLVAVVVLGSALGWATGPAAESAPRWTPASRAAIRPGAVMITDGAQCTAGFVFTRGGEVFLGYAAHCAGLGAPTDTNGCTTPSLPLGTPVQIEGAARPGVLVYSSWLAMQRNRERNASACAGNDFALVKVDPRDVPKVNPTMPFWGGPTGLNRGTLPSGSSVYGYGSSELRLGTTLLSPRSGTSTGTVEGGWRHAAYTISPGIPGDSGSGLLGADGRAAGILSTVNLTPQPLSNYFGDLQRMLAYARVNGMGNTVLALGTVGFRPDRLPLG